jgi:hypothetical protein
MAQDGIQCLVLLAVLKFIVHIMKYYFDLNIIDNYLVKLMSCLHTQNLFVETYVISSSVFHKLNT